MRSQNSNRTAADRYARIVRTLRRDERVTGPTDDLSARGFGSGALKTRNKIFAMLSSKGEFVVKLPRHRVDDLVAAGVGERFDSGRGRAMKEWLVIRETAHRHWLRLAREAMLYGLGASRPKGGPSGRSFPDRKEIAW